MLSIIPRFRFALHFQNDSTILYFNLSAIARFRSELGREPEHSARREQAPVSDLRRDHSDEPAAECALRDGRLGARVAGHCRPLRHPLPGPRAAGRRAAARGVAPAPPAGRASGRASRDAREPDARAAADAAAVGRAGQRECSCHRDARHAVRGAVRVCGAGEGASGVAREAARAARDARLHAAGAARRAAAHVELSSFVRAAALRRVQTRRRRGRRDARRRRFDRRSCGHVPVEADDVRRRRQVSRHEVGQSRRSRRRSVAAADLRHRRGRLSDERSAGHRESAHVSREDPRGTGQSHRRPVLLLPRVGHRRRTSGVESPALRGILPDFVRCRSAESQIPPVSVALKFCVFLISETRNILAHSAVRTQVHKT